MGCQVQDTPRVSVAGSQSGFYKGNHQREESKVVARVKGEEFEIKSVRNLGHVIFSVPKASWEMCILRWDLKEVVLCICWGWRLQA